MFNIFLLRYDVAVDQITPSYLCEKHHLVTKSIVNHAGHKQDDNMRMCCSMSLGDEWCLRIFRFVRELPGLSSKLVLINFDDAGGDSTINLNSKYDKYVPATGTVTFVSQSSGMSVDVGQQFNFGGFSLPPSRGIIIDFERQDILFHEGAENECFIHTKVCYDKALGIVKTC